MKKILIVDDQDSWRNLNKNVIQRYFGSNVNLFLAESAFDAYSLLLEHARKPFDLILTDMQMENNYAPKMAGEWLIEQIQMLPSYYKTKIIIISAAPMINHIADSYGVQCIPKSIAITSAEAFYDAISSLI